MIFKEVDAGMKVFLVYVFCAVFRISLACALFSVLGWVLELTDGGYVDLLSFYLSTYEASQCSWRVDAKSPIDSLPILWL